MSGNSPSAWFVGGAAELEHEVDQPLDLLTVKPAGEARHRAVALGDALADGRAVTAPHHGRGEEVEVRVEIAGARIARALFAMAAGAVGLVELGRREVLPGAARRGQQRRQKRQRRHEEEQPELQGVKSWRDRFWRDRGGSPGWRSPG